MSICIIPASQEQKMGVESYGQLMHDPKVVMSHDPAEVDAVQRVAQRIITAAKKSKYSKVANEFQWEVTVIKDDQTMNAFALPGGKIVVYTGIFPVAKTGVGGWYYEAPEDNMIHTRELSRQIPNISRARDGWIDELAPVGYRQPIKNWPITVTTCGSQ